MRETAEMLYLPYLDIMWKFSYLAEGVWPKKRPAEFGALVKQASEDFLKYPELVEHNAGWLRNAASHAHWIYYPSEDGLVMWDSKVKPQKISVNKLLSIVISMYQIAGPTLLHVYQLYMIRNVFINSGLCEVFKDMPGLFAQDKGKSKRAEEMISEKVRTAFIPLETFIKSHKTFSKTT